MGMRSEAGLGWHCVCARVCVCVWGGGLYVIGWMLNLSLCRRLGHKQEPARYRFSLLNKLAVFAQRGSVLVGASGEDLWS